MLQKAFFFFLNKAVLSVPDEGRWEGSCRSLSPEWEKLHLILIKAAHCGDARLSLIVRYAQMMRPAVQYRIFQNNPCRKWTLPPGTYGLHGSHLFMHSKMCKLCTHTHGHTCRNTQKKTHRVICRRAKVMWPMLTEHKSYSLVEVHQQLQPWRWL